MINLYKTIISVLVHTELKHLCIFNLSDTYSNYKVYYKKGAVTVRLFPCLDISVMFRGPYGRLAVELNMSSS